MRHIPGRTMTVQQIRELAAAEAREEEGCNRATVVWRRAWWATTLALGSIPEGEKKLIGEALAIVREATGQAVVYVSRRRRTGRAFVNLKVNETETIPPSMAILVVENGRTPTSAIVKLMLEIDADPDRGVREFLTALTGKNAADTPEGMSPETIEKIVTAQPEAVAEVVSRKPRVAQSVVENLSPTSVADLVKNVPTETFDQVKGAVYDVLREKHPPPTEPHPLDVIIEQTADWAKVEALLAKLEKALDRYGLVTAEGPEAQALTTFAMRMMDRIVQPVQVLR